MKVLPTEKGRQEVVGFFDYVLWQMKMYLVGWMMNNRKIRSRLGNKLNEGMVAPYKKITDK